MIIGIIQDHASDPASRSVDPRIAYAAAADTYLLYLIDRCFSKWARVATLLVAASGFYMVDRLDLWERFRAIEFWWMHAMVLLWFIFTLILFVGEPLVARLRRRDRGRSIPEVNLAWTQWLHWVLLILSASLCWRRSLAAGVCSWYRDGGRSPRIMRR